MTRWLTIFFIVVVVLSVWIFFYSGKHPKSKSLAPGILDGYMIQARFTEYDTQGQVHMIMESPKVTHYAQENTSFFDHPYVLAYSQQRVPWTIQAIEGKALHNTEQIELWGNVIIHQTPEPGYPETTMTTTALTIFPHRGYAQTNQAVKIVRSDAQIAAIGMQADFKAGIFKLLSSVRGRYVPKDAH
ncbi:MAG: LPS export ABC transporter periplasmic protein LptC [Proteobacteria bacterium]|nr:LPS export ABC transporter periplasmic protein LptC [Pseudomonadota bacterium]